MFLTSVQNIHLHCWIRYVSLTGQSIKQILHKMGGSSVSFFGEFTVTLVVLCLKEGIWDNETWLVYLDVILKCKCELSKFNSKISRILDSNFPDFFPLILFHKIFYLEWFIDSIDVHLEQMIEEAPDLNLFWGCIPY